MLLWHDKRGVNIGAYSVFWATFRVLFTVAVIITLVVFTRGFVRVEQETFPLEASLFVDRVVADGPLVARDVHTARVLPGVLEGKASVLDLDGVICYGSCDVAPLAAKISVGGKTVWFHRQMFELLAAIPKDVSGPGGVDVAVIRRAVVVRQDDGSLKSDILVAEVRAPRGGG